MFNSLLKRKEATFQLGATVSSLYPLSSPITLVPALWICPLCTGQEGLDLITVLIRMYVQLLKHD